jgi:hypothetical protein
MDFLKVFYCFSRLASAFFKFSVNLNFTILLIRLKELAYPMETALNLSRRYKQIAHP